MNALYQITPHFETMERGFRIAKEPEGSEVDPIKAIANIIQVIRSYLF